MYDSIAGSRKIITCLRIFGLWPMPPDTARPLRYLPWLLHVPLSICFVGLMLLRALLGAQLAELVNLLYILLTEFGMAVKIINVYWYKRLTMRIFDDWQHNAMYAVHSDAEAAWWQRAHRRFAVMALVFWCISYCSLLCTIAPELVYATRRLPFQLLLPQWLRGERYYYPLFGYEFVAMSWNCVCNTTLDLYNCYLPFHLSLVYRVLEWRLAEIGQRRRGRSDEPHEQIVEVIALQQSAKSLSLECDRILCWPMLFQVFLSMVVLCCSAYRLQSLEVDEDTIGLFAFPYLITMVLQIYLPCYYANEITLASERLCTSLYSSNWLELPADSRRVLLLYMVYLKRPIVLRAGGFFAIGLPLFSKVINNAYSLLALLLNMDN